MCRRKRAGPPEGIPLFGKIPAATSFFPKFRGGFPCALRSSATGRETCRRRDVPQNIGGNYYFCGINAKIRKIYGNRSQIHARRDRIEMVRLLAASRLFSFDARRTGTLYDRHSAAQRHRHAAHGTHAQRNDTGRARPPGPHAGQERLLGAGYRPRFDRHGGQGGPEAQGRGHRQEFADPRGVPPPCVGMERKTRRHHPQSVAQAGRFVRLETDQVHDGPRNEPQRHQGVRRSVQ